MKCIEGEYGNICREGGLFSRKVVQNDTGDEREYTFSLYTIRKILRAYRRIGDDTITVYDYGMVKDENNNRYSVNFNREGPNYKRWSIKIGCKYYSKETVEAAIKAFL